MREGREPNLQERRASASATGATKRRWTGVCWGLCSPDRARQDLMNTLSPLSCDQWGSTLSHCVCLSFEYRGTAVTFSSPEAWTCYREETGRRRRKRRRLNDLHLMPRSRTWQVTPQKNPMCPSQWKHLDHPGWAACHVGECWSRLMLTGRRTGLCHHQSPPLLVHRRQWMTNDRADERSDPGGDVDRGPLR